MALSGPFSTAATNRSPPCSAQVTSGARVRPFVSSSQRADAVGVHEVEPLVLDAREQRGALGGLDGVPAHVRDDRRLQPLDRPGPLAAALGLDAVLDAALEEHLHADADAEHRPAAGQPPPDHRVAAHRAQPVHAGGERADAGHDQAVGVQRGLAVGGQSVDLGAGPLERADGRAQVARPVVEDDDLRGRSERALRGRDAGLARVDRDRVAQRAGERLELGLDDVVRVAAGQHPDVQRDLGVEGDGLEDVAGQRARRSRRR